MIQSSFTGDMYGRKPKPGHYIERFTYEKPGINIQVNFYINVFDNNQLWYRFDYHSPNQGCAFPWSKVRTDESPETFLPKMAEKLFQEHAERPVGFKESHVVIPILGIWLGEWVDDPFLGMCLTKINPITKEVRIE